MIRTYGVLIAVFLVSAQAAIAGEANPRILVTVPPLKPYIDSLLGGIGQADNLLRPGQDAHTFTLSPSQRKALARADIIVLPDRHMNALLERLLANEQKRGARIVALTELPEAAALPYEDSNPWLKTIGLNLPDDDEEEAQLGTPKSLVDPHVWLDPIRMADLAMPVAEAIGRVSPIYRETLRQNARELADHLRREVSPGITDIFARARRHNSMSARPQVPFITYHAAYQYFTKRYQLENNGEITQRPEDYLGARTLHDVMDEAGKVSIRCIISETQSPLVTRVAQASGATVVTLSPEAIYSSDDVPPLDWPENDYDRLLLKTAESFADCL